MGHAEQKAVVDWRNELRAHGYVREGTTHLSEAAVQVEQGIAQLRRLFEKREFGWELRVVRSIALNKPSHGSHARYEVSGERMVGSNTLCPTFDDELPRGVAPLDRGIVDTRNAPVMLRSGATGEYVSLSPYYLFRECGECHHPRLLVADGKLTARGGRYIDLVVGHRAEIND